jgi:Fe-S-cluster containining protein
MSAEAPAVLHRYRELTAKVDAFFFRVWERHRAAMACAPGCSECCHQRLTITGVEAAFIEEGLTAMSPEELEGVRRRAAETSADECAALGSDGRCTIYGLRPLVCRSHGAPIRVRDPETALPVINACHLNFTGDDELAALPAEDIFDQTTISTVLGALDAAHADAEGRPRGKRFDLAALLMSHGS